MAREVIERLIDDLDGGPAVETVSFGLDGTGYEVDLNKKNALALRKSLERYIGAARTAATRPARPRSAAPSTTPKAGKGKGSKGATSTGGYDLARLREWATANEVAVPTRGRIPKAVVAQYQAAGGR